MADFLCQGQCGHAVRRGLVAHRERRFGQQAGEPTSHRVEVSALTQHQPSFQQAGHVPPPGQHSLAELGWGNGEILDAEAFDELLQLVQGAWTEVGCLDSAEQLDRLDRWGGAVDDRGGGVICGHRGEEAVALRVGGPLEGVVQCAAQRKAWRVGAALRVADRALRESYRSGELVL
ncbi:MAG: hypothetical protein M3228_05105 [Actinomycetota bacterium]|nr:hypothetical protein [Actinomycetota bacterium]